MNVTSKSPLRTGWESVKANALPMVVLWALAAALAVGYYFVPGVVAALKPVAAWQTDNRALGALANRFVFCGIVPGVLVFMTPSIRPRCPYRTILAETLWNLAWAVPFEAFYRLQAMLFGGGTNMASLLLKTAVDQLVWTVFLIAPLNAVFFFWIGRGFSFRRMRAEWPLHWIRDLCLPNLFSNWCLWVPVTLLVYAFPTPLQIHVSGLCGSFWVLLCLELGRRSGCPSSAT